MYDEEKQELMEEYFYKDPSKTESQENESSNDDSNSGNSPTKGRGKSTKSKKENITVSDFTSIRIDPATHRLLKRLQAAYYFGDNSRMNFSTLIRELIRLSKNRLPDSVIEQLGEGFWQGLKK